MKALAYAKLGLLGLEVWRMDLFMLPTLAAGVGIGILMNTRLSVVWFNRAILALVLVIGFRLIDILKPPKRQEVRVSRPVIGITTSVRTSDGGDSRQEVGRAYVSAVERAGGCPVILPMVERQEALAPVLGLIDGLIITGGSRHNGRVDWRASRRPAAGRPDPCPDGCLDISRYRPGTGSANIGNLLRHAVHQCPVRRRDIRGSAGPARQTRPFPQANGRASRTARL